ncbi:quinolinate synthase NadA [Candidatus Woesearchaeota archaeon]|nr:quinolinate synthase NadA [Candidatus Woesearchaeota archaeon]
METPKITDDGTELEKHIDAIKRLKQERHALVLCHTYQRPEIHLIADIVGDSYALSLAATKTTHPIIVFCGVHFMAETAKILNPSKKVLLPTLDAGCGLAETITANGVRAWKAQYPGLPLVLYINSPAAVKAEADIICTSTNTLKAVEAAYGETVLLAPDKNLYYNTQPKTRKKLIPWEGYCPVHKAMSVDMLEYAMMLHPDAEVIVHPECNPDVTALAHAVLSTSGMVDYVKASSKNEFIIGTELGLVQMIQRMFPEKKVYPFTEVSKTCDNSCVCPYMKAVTIEKVRQALEKDRYEIAVPEEIRIKALAALQRMLLLGRDT